MLKCQANAKYYLPFNLGEKRNPILRGRIKYLNQ